MKPCINRAFTMVEIIFVIVIVGILSAMAVPRFNQNGLDLALKQLAMHIRYTQYLALQDDRFDADVKYWYKQRWQIIFYKNITNTAAHCSRNLKGAWGYTIFSDDPNYAGKPDPKEMAKNPQNINQVLSGGYNNSICIDNAENKIGFKSMKELRLGEQYGIKDIKLSSSCKTGRSMRISFDYLGRPLRGALNGFTSPYPSAKRVVTSKCYVSLCTVSPCPKKDGEHRRSIVIEPETGYVYIKPLVEK